MTRKEIVLNRVTIMVVKFGVNGGVICWFKNE